MSGNLGATDFGGMQSREKEVWQRGTWKECIDSSFMRKYLGKSDTSIIHRITDLTKDERGSRVIMQLRGRLRSDGVVDDNDREGKEEQLTASECELQISLLSHGVRNKGKLSDQLSVLNFRTEARPALAEWLKERLDELAILTLSGIGYSVRTNGAPRGPSSQLPNLRFAADVTAPTSKRHFRYNGTEILPGDTTAIDSNHVLKYGAIVDIIAYLKATYMRGVNAVDSDMQHYIFLLHPLVMANLRKDADFQRALVKAGPRDLKKNPWFTGAEVTVHGMVFHEHNLAYNTIGAAAGSKWGSGGNVNGARNLILGAQALGFADIGLPSWVEKPFQYDSRHGINVDKMFGFKKPRFMNSYTGDVQDYGVCALDTYIQASALA